MNTSGYSTYFIKDPSLELEMEYSIPIELSEGDTIVAEYPIMLEKQ